MPVVFWTFNHRQIYLIPSIVQILTFRNIWDTAYLSKIFSFTKNSSFHRKCTPLAEVNFNIMQGIQFVSFKVIFLWVRFTTTIPCFSFPAKVKKKSLSLNCCLRGFFAGRHLFDVEQNIVKQWFFVVSMVISGYDNFDALPENRLAMNSNDLAI